MYDRLTRILFVHGCFICSAHCTVPSDDGFIRVVTLQPTLAKSKKLVLQSYYTEYPYSRAVFENFVGGACKFSVNFLPQKSKNLLNLLFKKYNILVNIVF